jgi:Alcohol dehydrogenase GroES-like domain
VKTDSRTRTATAHSTRKSTMRAARYTTATGMLAVVDVPVPEPGPGEVLVKIAFCGICLTDVHIVDGHAQTPLDVVTPGHESAGTIERRGPDVPEIWAAGDRVVIYSARRDSVCAACIIGGDAEQCLSLQVMGVDYDGAWAEFVVAPHTALVAVPEGVPLRRCSADGEPGRGELDAVRPPRDRRLDRTARIPVVSPPRASPARDPRPPRILQPPPACPRGARAIRAPRPQPLNQRVAGSRRGRRGSATAGSEGRQPDQARDPDVNATLLTVADRPGRSALCGRLPTCRPR